MDDDIVGTMVLDMICFDASTSAWKLRHEAEKMDLSASPGARKTGRTRL